MANAYSADDLLDFLDRAAERGLLPVATAQALGVATRNVLGVLGEQEKRDLSQQDLDAVIKRFNNKRAKDFSPSSLKEYARRLHRAVELFAAWRDDPANFTVRTRATASARKHETGKSSAPRQPESELGQSDQSPPSQTGTYDSAIPVRPGVVVTLTNVPHDLTKAEAERLAGFVRMLAIEP